MFPDAPDPAFSRVHPGSDGQPGVAVGERHLRSVRSRRRLGLCDTPFMIGDFFGFTGSSVRFGRQSANRLGVFTRNLPRQNFFPPTNPLSVQQNGVNGNVTLNPDINGAGFGTGVQVVPLATGGFTSTLSSNQVRDLLFANNAAIVPIVDANSYNAIALAQAQARFGQGGMLVFLPGESGALALNPAFGDNILSSGFDVLYTYDYLFQLQVASPSTSGVAVGRQKITENGSPLPRDRVFLDTGFLDNGGVFPGGVDVQRIVPGFEKTFCNGRCSIEMRFPFASTLDSDILAAGATNTSEIELGNLTTYLKCLLAGGDCCDTYAVSAGIGFALPTGDDVRVLDGLGRELVVVDNDSFHLLPFIGGVWNPTGRCFVQGFAQLDLDTNGNRVHVRDFQQNRLVRAGRAQDVQYAYLDLNVGYWMHRARSPYSCIQGIAPMAELHYNLPLNETDVVNFNGFQVGNWADRAEALNAVIGMTVALRNDSTITAGYVTPLGSWDDQYDRAFRVTVNCPFGPRRR